MIIISLKKLSKMVTIELPKEIIGDLTFAQFDDLCKHFGCSCEGKTRYHSYIIETDDPINFFWLGANLYFKYETPLTISIAEKIKQTKITKPCK